MGSTPSLPCRRPKPLALPTPRAWNKWTDADLAQSPGSPNIRLGAVPYLLTLMP